MRVFVCPVSDVLFDFLAAGFGVRMEVKVHHPGVENEAHGGEERLGERCAGGEVEKNKQTSNEFKWSQN